METKFKVGDRVKCIDASGFGSKRKELVLGREYIVRGFTTHGVVLLDGIFNENERGYGIGRFELVDKNMNNKPDAFWVSVNDPIVSEFIQKLLFKNGFGWNTSNGTNIQHSDEPHLLISFKTRIWGNKTIHYSERISETQFPSYDAVKDLQKIMELLETPSMPLPVVNGYTMGEYKKGDAIVKFGCAEISVRLLKELFAVMDFEWNGNRKPSKIVLNSGVILGKTDVENILKYIEFVDKN